MSEENLDPNNPSPSAAPPPAAKVVLTGTKTEREIALEAELAEERASHAKTAKEKKDRETRICELEDLGSKREATVREMQKPAEQKRRSIIEDLNSFIDGEDD